MKKYFSKPSVSQEIDGAQIGGHAIQIAGAGNITINLGEGNCHVRPLLQEPRPTDPSTQKPPSYLLDPHLEIVPYARRAEQDLLAEWCRNGSDASAQLLFGAGGHGKTRLARYVARQLVDAGWQAHGATIAAFDSSELVSTLEPGDTPRLIVVDYAERWPLATLAELIRQTSTLDGGVLRLLLISRSQSFWPDARAAFDRSRVEFVDRPIELCALQPGSEERGELFTSALRAFATALAADVPESGASQAWPTPATFLDVHMSALAGVLAARDDDDLPPATATSTYLLRHERRYWQSLTTASDTIEDAVFAATLFGPVTTAGGLDVLRHLHVADGPAEGRRVLRAHRRLYPGTNDPEHSDGTLFPLRPDRLGEDFVAEYLALHDDAAATLDAAFRAITADSAWSGHLLRRAALEVLASAGLRYAHVRVTVLGVLRLQPGLAQSGGRSLVELVRGHGQRSDAVAVFRGLCGGFLSEELIRPTIALGRDVWASTPALDLDAVARIGSGLGNLLAVTGQWAEAAEVSERALAAADSAASGFTADQLASILNTRSAAAANLGDFEEATEAAHRAVEILETSTAGDGRDTALHLAGVLSNLSLQLDAEGRAAEALSTSTQAVERYRAALDGGNDPSVEDMSGYATVLHNHACRLLDDQQVSESVTVLQSALEIRVQLYQISLPRSREDVASTLLVLRDAHLQSGDVDKACEASEIARDILRDHDEPESNPLAAARAAVTHSATLVRADRPDEVVAELREALPVLRESYDREETGRVDLVLALNNLTIASQKLRDHEGAAEYGYEAAERAETLANRSPGVYSALLSMSLHNLTNALDGAGNTAEALAASNACLAVCRWIERHGGSAPLFVPALRAQERRLRDAGHLDEAEAHDREIALREAALREAAAVTERRDG